MKYFKQVSKRCFAMLLTFIMAMGLLQTTAFAAAKWHTVTLVPASTNSYSSKITSAKVRVGQTVNGYEVTSVSGTTIQVKAWGDLYGDFFLPRAANLWNGAIASDYVIWAGTGSSQKTEGGSAMLPQSNASAYYYFNTPGSVEGGGGGSSSNLWNFTLKYNANGGSGAPDDDTWGTDSKYTKSHTFTISSTEPTRANYTFLGWSETSGSSNASYDPGDSYLMSQTATGYNGGSVTKTLYAVWQKNAEKVTLTYDANGGINPPAAQTVDKGTDVTIKGQESMTNGIDEFLGWSVNSDAATADWAAGDTMKLNANTTLYAVWKHVDPNPAIAVTKTVDGSTTVKPGDPVKFNITVQNTGNVDFRMVAVSDTLPDGLTYNSATGNPMTTTPYIVWVLQNVPAKESRTFEVTATVGANATGTLTNTVNVSGQTSDNTQVKASDTASVTVEEAGPTDPSTRTGNFPVVKNFAGLADGVEGPQVTLTYESWRTKDGAMVGTKETGAVTLTKQSDGTYSGAIAPTVWDIASDYSERDHYKNVIVIVEDLQSATVDGYTLNKFGPLYVADAVNDGDSRVQFTLDGATFRKTLSVKNTYTENPGIPELVITKSVDKPEVNVGDTVTYTITVKNTGDATANNVKIVDVLDGNLEWQSASYSWTAPAENPGGYDAVSNEAGTKIYPAKPTDGVYEVDHEMRPGAELVLTITAKATAAGEVKNQATVKGDDIPDKPSNEVTTTVNPDPAKPELDISKSIVGDVKAVAKGAQVTYSIVVKNTSEVEAKNVVVTDQLPEGLKFVSSLPGKGSCSADDNGVVTWNIGDLSKNEGAKELWIVVNANVVGDTVNIATVDSDETDPKDSDPVPLKVSGKAIAVTKSLKKDDKGYIPVDENGVAKAEYEVTVTNTSGKDLYGLTIIDRLKTDFQNREDVEMRFVPVSLTINGTEYSKDPVSTFADGTDKDGNPLKETTWTVLDRNATFAKDAVAVLKYYITVENMGEDDLTIKLDNTAKGGSWEEQVRTRSAAPQDDFDVEDEASQTGGTASGSAVIPGKVTITVNFVDEEGNIVGTETKKVVKDSAYDVTEETEKIPTGYVANGDPTGDTVTGTADSDKTITVPVKRTDPSTEYTVTYEWNLPKGAAAELPTEPNHKVGESVTVDDKFTNTSEVKTEDGVTYVFSGWTTKNATIKNGSFTMPGKNVTITGTWTKKSVEGSLGVEKRALIVTPENGDPYVNFTIKLTSHLSGPQKYIQLRDVMQVGLDFEVKDGQLAIKNAEGELVDLTYTFTSADDGQKYNYDASGSWVVAENKKVGATDQYLDEEAFNSLVDKYSGWKEQNREAIMLIDLKYDPANGYSYFNEGDTLEVTYSAKLEDGITLEAARNLYNHVYATTWDA